MVKTEDNVEGRKRPVIITIICILGFIGVAVVGGALVSEEQRTELLKQYGPAFVYTTGALTAFGAAGLAGLWMMRRWGAYIYIAMQITSVLYGLALGAPRLLNYAAAMALVVIIALNYKKMS